METIPGRSGEAERDDQVPRSVVKTEVGSPEQSLIVCIKEEAGEIQDSCQNRTENTGVTYRDQDVKPLVDKPFPVALYKVDRTLRTNSRLMANSPDSTERQFDLSLGLVDMKYTGDTESSNTTHTDEADYANTEREESLHGERSCRCTLCSYSCVDQSSLRRHMKTHPSEKPYKCSFCSYSCLQKSSLKDHQTIHTGEKPYKCSLCSNSYPRKTGLRDHQMTHTGEKPYKCSSCPYRAALSTSLHRHLKTHTGEKPHKCTMCPYSTAYRICLRNHMTTHTGEKLHVKSYKCTICPCKFSGKKDLVMHMKGHTDEMPYTCLHCSFSCGNRSALKKHIKVHNGE